MGNPAYDARRAAEQPCPECGHGKLLAMAHHRKIPLSFEPEICLGYLGGLKLDHIASAFPVTRAAVMRVLYRNHITPNRNLQRSLMPAQPLDEPVKKVTLNLYESDYKAMIGIHGHGWSSRIRELVREHVKKFGKENVNG